MVCACEGNFGWNCPIQLQLQLPTRLSSNSCVDGTKALLFNDSICLLRLGGGGIRGSALVYVSATVGWDIGFIISMSCSFVGLIFAALGKPFYRVQVAGDSPLLRIVEVLVVSVKNWRTKVPHNSDDLSAIRDHESASRGSHPPQQPIQVKQLDRLCCFKKQTYFILY
ncbi:hypothetical protein Pint_05589 [Pistacia integerrima]|uniref:Uncharacterized protein n=1 Tax=Pistacia integerrima TaxID=434235 RepID=A0ACC0Z577_9ROSI|nr:hypothetical protein Pint_05589 [Pistacia integerrima]